MVFIQRVFIEPDPFRLT